MYEAEKEAMDQWAVWRDRGFYDAGHLGIGKTPLQKFGEMGMRVGAVNYSAEPDHDTLSPRVEVFMRGLLATHPKAHLCLEARHRRVVGTIRIGLKVIRRGDEVVKMRLYKDSELAEALGWGPDHASRMRFRRLCDEGYGGLKSHLNGT